MAVKSRAVTVTTSATRLDTTTDQDDAMSGESFAVYNASAAVVYLGGSDVTTSNGVPVAATSWGPSFDLSISDQIYGIVAASTSEVRVIETGV
jgi:hypothetical protein